MDNGSGILSIGNCQSSGAISSLNYAAVSNHVPMIPYIVSLSARFHMADARRKHGPELMSLLETQVLSVQIVVQWILFACLINCSPNLRVQLAKQTFMYMHQGHFDWRARAAGKDITLRVTQQHFDDFLNFDSAAGTPLVFMVGVGCMLGEKKVKEC